MKGVTFIELIMATGLLILLALLSVPFAGSFLVRNNMATAVFMTKSLLWKAQSFASDGREVSGSRMWGVCFTSNTVRLYNGTCASPNLRNDYSLPVGVSLTGLGDLSFSSLSGAPNGTANIVISSQYGTKTINVNAVGVVQEN